VVIAVDILALALATIALARLARAAGLPPLLGMIIGGALVGVLVDIHPLDALRLDDVSRPIRLAVLALVLLRAGLGISLPQLKKAGGLGLRLGGLPLLGDGVAVALGSWLLLDLQPASAAVLGCLVAAISPAIVIPGLLGLLDRRGRDGGQGRVLNALLVGAPIDNILALVGLGIALDLALGGAVSAGQISRTLVGGTLLGVLLGLVAGVALSAALRPRLGRTSGPGSRTAGLLCWCAAAGLVALGQVLDFSFVLAVLTLGMVLRHRSPELADSVNPALQRYWDVAAYALFGLIGMAVDLGPLADAGTLLLLLVVLGQAGRAVGSLLATVKSGLTRSQRAACVLAYVPKATIQAAFASLPLDRGLEQGTLMLTLGVLAVVITAPVGVLTLHRGVDNLLDRDSAHK